MIFMLKLEIVIYMFKITLSYTSVLYLLWNGLVYGSEIWHADTCRPCVGPLLGFMSIGVIVMKKINILFAFSNVNKLAVNRFGLRMVGSRVGHVGGWPTARLLLLADRGVSSSHIPIHYAEKTRDGARSAISIQQDGAHSATGMGHSSQNHT